MATEVATSRRHVVGSFERDLRRVAAAASAGLVAGFVVNGVGSRLAMMLLARLNPHVTGRLSDDGFVMGRFTLADTLGLVVFATAVGVLGGLLFLVLRDLRVGPVWFRTASMTLGPAVVVGAMLVHTDGIDFRVLEPVWLAIALFVALPGLFAWSVGDLVDRWLAPDAWPTRTRVAWTAGLAPLLLLTVANVLVVGGLAVRVVHRSVPRLRRVTATRTWPNLVRTGLGVVFALSLWELARDVVELV